ncbi:MAG TPA: GNAT family N-acetyltransferase [Candidatus Angelobacter sp.]|nr:GNAT family N-acetyltransferase [Candidatus Angelobacter sp.]
MLQLQILPSAQEIWRLQPVWERLRRDHHTIFQDFDWNLLAARMFADREAPHVIYAHASFGEAIIPAVRRHSNGRTEIGLLGEELFDYRSFLFAGDEEVLRFALARLADMKQPLRITAMRHSDCEELAAELTLSRFTVAPGIRHSQLSPDTFSEMHLRLARNLRRMQRLGYEFKAWNGAHSQLLRTIYELKAEQDPQSLFRDPLRREFMVEAALLQSQRIQIFTLENDCRLGAALVTLHDPGVRRFYTCWFAPELSKHSPALSLIYEVSRLSLADGLDCDYMTGEQSYKLRLATSAVQLVQVNATSDQLAALGRPVLQELKIAG